MTPWGKQNKINASGLERYSVTTSNTKALLSERAARIQIMFDFQFDQRVQLVTCVNQSVVEFV